MGILPIYQRGFLTATSTLCGASLLLSVVCGRQVVLALRKRWNAGGSDVGLRGTIGGAKRKKAPEVGTPGGFANRQGCQRDYCVSCFENVDTAVFKAALLAWESSTSTDLAAHLEKWGIPVPGDILKKHHLHTMDADGRPGAPLVDCAMEGIPLTLLRLMCPNEDRGMGLEDGQDEFDRPATARIVAAVTQAVGALTTPRPLYCVLNQRMECQRTRNGGGCVGVKDEVENGKWALLHDMIAVLWKRLGIVFSSRVAFSALAQAYEEKNEATHNVPHPAYVVGRGFRGDFKTALIAPVVLMGIVGALDRATVDCGLLAEWRHEDTEGVCDGVVDTLTYRNGTRMLGDMPWDALGEDAHLMSPERVKEFMDDAMRVFNVAGGVSSSRHATAAAACRRNMSTEQLAESLRGPKLACLAVATDREGKERKLTPEERAGSLALGSRVGVRFAQEALSAKLEADGRFGIYGTGELFDDEDPETKLFRLWVATELKRFRSRSSGSAKRVELAAAALVKAEKGGTEAQKKAARLEFATQEGIFLAQSSGGQHGSAEHVKLAAAALVKAEKGGTEAEKKAARLEFAKQDRIFLAQSSGGKNWAPARKMQSLANAVTTLRREQPGLTEEDAHQRVIKLSEGDLAAAASASEFSAALTIGGKTFSKVHINYTTKRKKLYITLPKEQLGTEKDVRVSIPTTGLSVKANADGTINDMEMGDVFCINPLNKEFFEKITVTISRG